MVAIADRVVVASPPALTSWAIDTFGTNDKPLLIATIVVVLAGAAAGLGVLALRRPFLAAGGVAGLGAVAVAAALAGPAGAGAALPGVAASVAGVLALSVLVAGLARRPEPSRDRYDDAGDAGRRRFLMLAATVAAGAAATAGAGRLLLARFDVEGARAALTLPAPSARRDLPAPAAAELDVAGITPLFTPNGELLPDRHRAGGAAHRSAVARLRVTGMVGRSLELPYAELLRRDLVEVPITIACSQRDRRRPGR